MNDWEELAIFAYRSFLKHGRGVVVEGTVREYRQVDDLSISDGFRESIRALVASYEPRKHILVLDGGELHEWRALGPHSPDCVHHNFTRTGWLPSKGTNPGGARRAFSPRKKGLS